MTSVPERADGVDDKTRGQIVSASDFRFTRLATAECPALREKLRSSGAMNGAIDSAAAKQRRIGRVHNCIDIECGDIAADDVDLHIHIFLHETGFKNSKARMRKDEGNPSAQMTNSRPERFLSSGFCHSFGIRYSSFVIASSLKLSW